MRLQRQQKHDRADECNRREKRKEEDFCARNGDESEWHEDEDKTRKEADVEGVDYRFADVRFADEYVLINEYDPRRDELRERSERYPESHENQSTRAFRSQICLYTSALVRTVRWRVS